MLVSCLPFSLLSLSLCLISFSPTSYKQNPGIQLGKATLTAFPSQTLRASARGWSWVVRQGLARAPPFLPTPRANCTYHLGSTCLCAKCIP